MKKMVNPVNEANEGSDSEGKNLEMDTPADPMKHPLEWLDEGLPDLSGYSCQEFDLALQFDI